MIRIYIKVDKIPTKHEKQERYASCQGRLDYNSDFMLRIVFYEKIIVHQFKAKILIFKTAHNLSKFFNNQRGKTQLGMEQPNQKRQLW